MIIIYAIAMINTALTRAWKHVLPYKNITKKYVYHV